MCKRYPLHCILPPHILEHMAASENPDVRNIAIENMVFAAEVRAVRSMLPRDRFTLFMDSEPGEKRREIYDAHHRPPFLLPGKLLMSEGETPPKGDDAAQEAYDYSGITYDFYYELFGRNSLDDNGMILVSSVHVGNKFNNAFWSGKQMAYGDGDGKIFYRFTKSIDVVGHELTHGVVDFTCDLVYEDEPGALNEHFADVFGTLIKQKHLGLDAESADWLIGAEILVPAPTRTALRSMAEPGTAYQNDPDLGSDPQPAHMDDEYTGSFDHGGVHINSGIPNHAFYLAAKEIGGNAWEKAGSIWYHSMLALGKFSSFQEAATQTWLQAGALFGQGGLEQQAVENAWKKVGLDVQ